ncbi:MAG: DUF1385 domain-containing protein [Chloroflexota bacterium]|nr:DUF1385 domain-containing protein [Chloroflexota bacterium]MDP6509177.1 DUF1385 domain-containing protein [Chloroflexota bacterium]MDP6756981.1 DUF1385 domain-containing protein [Chloroflexota bacterium]
MSATPDSPSSEERIAYGGQAVMEGVMMRSRRRMAVAVRHPAGHIVVKAEDIIPGRFVRVARRVPVLRGVAVLWDVLALGMRTLAFSANVGLEEDRDVASESDDSAEDAEAPSTNGATEAPAATASEETPEGGEGGTDVAVTGMLAFGLVFGIALFFVLPIFLTRLTDPLVDSDILSNLVEGLIRLAIFVSYLYLIGRLADIRRTYEYHGAEHMTVNALERGQQLTVENVIRNSLSHPRCGTNFLLVIVVISVIVFTFLGRPDLLLRVGSRIVLIPLVAGVAFEIIRALSARVDNPIARVFLQPGLWLQKLTTRPPTADQVEVAIAAMSEVLKTETERTLVPYAALPILEYRT